MLAAPGLAVLDRAVGRAAATAFEPRADTWRTWTVTTRVAGLKPAGVTRVWVPLPAVECDFQTSLGDTWSGNARTLERHADAARGVSALCAEFHDEPAPAIEVVSRVRTQDRAVDWAAAPARAPIAAEDARRWTAPTSRAPVDGIVADTARTIVDGRRDDRDRVTAVYDWILATMWRDTSVRGCGGGDVRAILETKRFGGKCGDINGVFVGLVRALGIPARDVYGLRVGPSRFGYQSLGPATSDVTKAQHCRAEVFLADHGWVAMDPADVAKVAREETSGWLASDDPIVTAVRAKLFGAWEGNWIAYNTAHDVALPNATDGTLGFFMYPQAETAEGRVDPLAPDAFRYTITAEPA